MKNESVVSAWLAGHRASTANLSTDGQKLWSYNLLIGDCHNGGRRVFDYTASGKYISQTTSCHVGLAFMADQSVTLAKPK